MALNSPSFHWTPGYPGDVQQEQRLRDGACEGRSAGQAGTTTVCGCHVDQLLLWTGFLSMSARKRWVPGTQGQLRVAPAPAQLTPAPQARPRAALRSLPAQDRAGAADRTLGSKYTNSRWGPVPRLWQGATRQGASVIPGPVREPGEPRLPSALQDAS